ncbi:class I SAM-dependent methyltransferase [Streptomyces sp. NPDC057638]|uniref:class I SAM-dependent methyltransferase n=1 Tax=Streptomyces sp. NPDC057638 TaxID=3346190 RepID=UPI0036BF726D
MSGHHHHHHHPHGTDAGTGTGTELDWDAMAPMLERGAEVETPLYRDALAWLAELAPPSGVRRVLDVGSGPGVLSTLLADAFPDAEIVAADATGPLLERARARAERHGYGDRFHTLRAELPEGIEALGEADVIWAGNAVHHIGDQGAALAGLAGLLRPGGVVAVVEGGLSTRRLPRDIGVGQPGLEARLDAVQSEWFQRMRDELPGGRRVTEDWLALFAAAGLTPTGTRAFLLDVPAPAPEPVREHVIQTFERLREIGERLDGDDRATLERLLDPEDPESLHRRVDVHYLTARAVHTARR